MPFAVTQAGYSPDPRQPDFAIEGFNFGQLPPWRFLMETTDAIFPYESLNDGVVWERSAHGIDFCSYQPLAPIPDVTDPQLGFSGTQEPSGGFTINWFCLFFMTGAGPATTGFLDELYPLAIKTRSFTMENVAGPPPFIPNPLVITPRKWNLD